MLLGGLLCSGLDRPLDGSWRRYMGTNMPVVLVYGFKLNTTQRTNNTTEVNTIRDKKRLINSTLLLAKGMQDMIYCRASAVKNTGAPWALVGGNECVYGNPCVQRGPGTMHRKRGGSGGSMFTYSAIRKYISTDKLRDGADGTILELRVVTSMIPRGNGAREKTSFDGTNVTSNEGLLVLYVLILKKFTWIKRLASRGAHCQVLKNPSYIIEITDRQQVTNELFVPWVVDWRIIGRQTQWVGKKGGEIHVMELRGSNNRLKEAKSLGSYFDVNGGM